MSTLFNKRILLGITGGIAAYKSADLIRRLREIGAEVRVVMTASAKAFMTPLTFQALSGHPVHDDLLDPAAEAAMGHIQLARWADLILVAPATADFMAHLGYGFAQDLLTTLCLATASPIAIVPAMNKNMWDNPATQSHHTLLKTRGIHIFGPAIGLQACGDMGPGRMLEPALIIEEIETLFLTRALNDKHVVITAGPTQEPLDPVRYFTNHSSGKMGFALAQAAVEAGAKVTLIAGPVHLRTPDRVKRIDIQTAVQMHEAVMNAIKGCDIFIGAAAVADYRCKTPLLEKHAKSPEGITVELIPNPDILADVAQQTPRPFTVGLAAQTHDLAKKAAKKLKEKKVDLIAANEVGRPDRGFGSDHNAFLVMWQGGQCVFELRSKSQLARDLIEVIAKRINS